MLLTILQCDLCQSNFAGKYGERGHTLRRRSRENGWRQGRLWGNGNITYINDGPMDFCPECVENDSNVCTAVNTIIR